MRVQKGVISYKDEHLKDVAQDVAQDVPQGVV